MKRGVGLCLSDRPMLQRGRRYHRLVGGGGPLTRFTVPHGKTNRVECRGMPAKEFFEKMKQERRCEG